MQPSVWAVVVAIGVGLWALEEAVEFGMLAAWIKYGVEEVTCISAVDFEFRRDNLLLWTSFDRVPQTNYEYQLTMERIKEVCSLA